MPPRRPPVGSLYERLDELLARAERPVLFVPAVATDPPIVALLSGSFDPMTIAFIDDPRLCPVQPMNIFVDEKGTTLRGSGAPNTQVCLKSDPEEFFKFYLGRLSAR